MSFFSVDDTRLFIVRHAEAQKNLDGIHGGGNQDLIVRGLFELKKSALLLENMKCGRTIKVFYQKEGRSKESAHLIAEELGTYAEECCFIYGVGLGVIADYSEDELMVRYPDVARILSGWKAGGAKLDDYPDIPGREHMADFANRIRDGMVSLLTPSTDIVIVGTTSTINMMNHLLSTDGEFIRDEYQFVSFPFSGINGWSLSVDAKPALFFSSF